MKNPIPFIPYGHQSIDDSDIHAVVQVLKSDWLSQGHMVSKFESQLANYCGAKYAVALSSGTAALHLAYMVADISSGDKVATPSFSFVATSNGFIHLGGIPIFIDIDSETCHMSIEKLEFVLKQNQIKAVVPVHYAGFPCDMEAIYRLAKKYSACVIDDACHALGTEYKGKKIGSCEFSDMTIFSFHPLKSITTGEGGAILTNDKRLYDRLITLRNHGLSKKPECGSWVSEMDDPGFNYRLTDFQCALGLSQLKRLDEFLQRRELLAKKYISLLSNHPKIQIPTIEYPYSYKSAWHLFPIRLVNLGDNKRGIIQKLTQVNIGTQVHCMPIHLQPFYRKKFNFKEGDLPVTETISDQILSIPLYADLTTAQVEYISKTLSEIVSSCA